LKGLRDKDLSDGKRENNRKFLKLIEMDLSATRLLYSLKINIIVNVNASTTAGQRIPNPNDLIDIFKSNKTTDEQVKEHINRAWSDSTYAATTPKYFSDFDTAPTDPATFDSLRNTTKLKHVMMGAKM